MKEFSSTVVSLQKHWGNFFLHSFFVLVPTKSMQGQLGLSGPHGPCSIKSHTYQLTQGRVNVPWNFSTYQPVDILWRSRLLLQLEQKMAMRQTAPFLPLDAIHPIYWISQKFPLCPLTLLPENLPAPSPMIVEVNSRWLSVKLKIRQGRSKS